MPNVRKIKSLAIVGFLAAIAFSQTIARGEDELVESYSAIAGDSESVSDYGWIARSEAGETRGESDRTESDPYGTERYPESSTSTEYSDSVRERRDKRLALRRSYRRRFSGERRNPYAWTSEANETDSLVETVNDDCECGEDCVCPPLVCKDKSCKMNYVFVVSAPAWCHACAKMHPTIVELRKEGYKVFYYDVDKFPDLDARFDVDSYPTFIVFDKGKETARSTGIVPKDWFTNRLRTIKEQENEPEPDPEPENPYDILVD